MAASTGSSEPESADSLKSFGAVVKVFRERSGLTQEELSPLVQFSPQTVASIEQGRRLAPPEFIDRAEVVLDAFGVLQAAAEHLTRRRPGLAAWFRQWAALEERAITLYTYECRMVPGLLQTEAYARSLFHSLVPPLSDSQVKAQLNERMKRQRLLRQRPNTTFSFILEEALFLRRTGGVDITRELIGHVLKCTHLRNLEIQVMPLVQENHAGLGGPMQLLETSKNQWFGYSEGQRTGHLISDVKEISVLQKRYARMRSQALTLEESTDLLERIRGAL
ncbi:helix-turn-helix transcriptional regulator [Streptomyces rimosus]|uniref:helix-turn-helix domain-containing protein n=1 Tax=Streptomyces rimosus TaxID=1927 RepID=UPI0031D175D8